MKLIICGNGFDMHHSLNTSYSSYKKHLHLKAPWVLEKYEKFPWLSEKVENDLWKDVEQSLELDFPKMINHYQANYNDPDGEIEYETDFENWTRFVFSFTGDEFYKWISSVEISTVKKDRTIESLFRDAVFVTFNYTDTIERLYQIPSDRVLHLHGELRRVADDNCFGLDILPSFRTIEEAECFNKPLLERDKWNSDIIRNEIQFGAPLTEENALTNIFNGVVNDDMRKAFDSLVEKTTKKLYQNIPILDAFLEGKRIDEVVIMGHSIIGADKLYYDKCIIPRYMNAKWTVYVHSDKDEKSAFFERYNIFPEYREW